MAAEKSKIDDGGPAFPVLQETDYLGISLRDYFAAKAMQGMMSNSWNNNYDDWAKHAYVMADSMLKARQQ